MLIDDVTAPQPTSTRLAGLWRALLVLAVGCATVAHADPRAPIEIDGPARSLTVTVPGEVATFVLEADAGTDVSISVSAPSWYDDVYLVAPDGAVLWVSRSCVPCDPRFGDVVRLPDTGTHSLVLDPDGSGVGTTSAQIWSVPPDATTAVAADGIPAVPWSRSPGRTRGYGSPRRPLMPSVVVPRACSQPGAAPSARGARAVRGSAVEHR